MLRHALVVLLALGAPAVADTVVLTNGARFEGSIEKENEEEVVIRVPGLGVMTVKRARIAKIERSGGLPPEPPPTSLVGSTTRPRPAPSRTPSPRSPGRPGSVST